MTGQPRLLVIGDSIAVHYSPHLERAVAGRFQWVNPGQLDEALRDLDVPSGANNGDSTTVLGRLRGLEAGGRAIPADVLLLNCGLHDIKTDPNTRVKQVPIDLYRSNLTEIAAVVRRLNAQLIWVRTTPCDERVHNARRTAFQRFAADCDAYNAVADEVMREHGVPIVDLHAFTSALGADLYCDHVHFPEPIRQLQGAFLGGWLIGWQFARSQTSQRT